MNDIVGHSGVSEKDNRKILRGTIRVLSLIIQNSLQDIGLWTFHCFNDFVVF